MRNSFYRSLTIWPIGCFAWMQTLSLKMNFTAGFLDGLNLARSLRTLSSSRSKEVHINTEDGKSFTDLHRLPSAIQIIQLYLQHNLANKCTLLQLISPLSNATLRFVAKTWQSDAILQETNRAECCGLRGTRTKRVSAEKAILATAGVQGGPALPDNVGACRRAAWLQRQTEIPQTFTNCETHRVASQAFLHCLWKIQCLIGMGVVFFPFLLGAVLHISYLPVWQTEEEEKSLRNKACWARSDYACLYLN